MLTNALLSIFLVLLNGFFVAAEFAIVKVRSSQIEVSARKGSFIGRMALNITHHLDAYLAATQLGITIASIALGWVAEESFAEIIFRTFQMIGFAGHEALAHKLALPVAFALITFMHVVFGELAPKSFSIRFPLQVTLAVAIPLRIFYVVFLPFIWLFNGFANLILKTLGFSGKHKGDTHSEEELRLLIRESRDEGKIEPGEYELIQNVFEFDKRQVKQVLVPRTRISAVEIDTPLQEVIETANKEQFSRMPVYQDSLDNIKGIIHVKDLLKLNGQPGEKTLAGLLRPPLFIPASKRIFDLLREFQKTRTGMAVVVDEFGGVTGLVTLEDVLEEIVGEIQDEFDAEKAIVEKVSEDEYLARAQASISDLNKHLPAPLPFSENYETLAGMTVFAFGRVPEPGEKTLFAGYELTVTKRIRFTVSQVKLKYAGKPPAAGG